ncbi:MAG: ATP-binding protein [Exilispira sp.]
MGIRISRMIFQDLGPIKERKDLEFKDFNLIYAKNERGKSLIVEFIIRTLFNKKSQNKEKIDLDWGYLRKFGSGKVFVKGIKSLNENFNHDEVEFESNSNNKYSLLNFLTESPLGLPASLPKLLVVKEGEVSIEKDYEEGISINFVKQIFSMDKILDSIANDEEKIKKNIKNYVEETRISESIDKNELIDLNINKIGIVKDLDDYNNQIKNLDTVLEKFIKSYQESDELELELKLSRLKKEKELLLKAKRYLAFKKSEELKDLKNKKSIFNEFEIYELEKLINEYDNINNQKEKLISEINNIEKQLECYNSLLELKDRLLKAKGYKAYLLFQSINELKSKLEKYSEDEISSLSHKIEDYYKNKEKLNQIKQQIKEYEEIAKDYNFLFSAKEVYERFLNEGFKEKKSKFLGSKISFIILSTLIILSGFLSSFNFNLMFRIILLLTGIIGILFLFISIDKLFKYKKEDLKDKEIQSIKKSFIDLYKVPLKDIAQINEKLKNTEYYKIKLEDIKAKFNEITTELKTTFNYIVEKFNFYGYLNSDENINQIENQSLNEKDILNIFQQIKTYRSKIKEEFDQARAKYERLGVDSELFVVNNPKIEYDENRFREVDEQIKKMQYLKDEKEKKQIEKEELERNAKKTEEKIKQILSDINELINELIFETPENKRNNWRNLLNKMNQKMSELNYKILKLEGEISGLGIDENEYEKKDPGIKYYQKRFTDIEREIEILNDKIQETKKINSGIKAELAGYIGIDPNAEIAEILDKIYQKKEELIKIKKELEAKILSSILVYESIIELKKDEDEKLKSFFQSQQIKDSIYSLTSRYDKILYENDIDFFGNSNNKFEIFIADKTNKFNLKDISTGAKEQVMLALRIGFLRYLFKSEKGFLILDDAFQHSDYDRRKILVDSLVNLAKDEWQIFYLTMDDHIRDLIKSRAQNQSFEFLEITL